MEKLEGLDLRAKMIVEKSSADQLNGFQAALDSSATIALKSWQSNEIKYQFNSTGSKEQLVAFSEVYYNSGNGGMRYADLSWREKPITGDCSTMPRGKEWQPEKVSIRQAN